MSEKEYVSRQEALSELKSGFFPQDVVYTEAVSIAEQILRAVPAADVVPKSEVVDIIKEVDSMIELVSAMVGLDIIAFGKYAELKKKYTEDQNG